MTSTITEAGPYDALEKAEPGEPMFPILGRDPCGPATITEWCRLRRNHFIKLYGESKKPSEMALLAAELQKTAHAERVAMDLQEWRQGHVAKDGERASYQDVTRSAEELAEAGRRQVIERAVRDLREAAYHLCEAKDALISLELIDGVGREGLEYYLIGINGLADSVAPKRPGSQPALPIAEGV